MKRIGFMLLVLVSMFIIVGCTQQSAPPIGAGPQVVVPDSAPSAQSAPAVPVTTPVTAPVTTPVTAPVTTPVTTPQSSSAPLSEQDYKAKMEYITATETIAITALQDDTTSGNPNIGSQDWWTCVDNGCNTLSSNVLQVQAITPPVARQQSFNLAYQGFCLEAQAGQEFKEGLQTGNSYDFSQVAALSRQGNNYFKEAADAMSAGN